MGNMITKRILEHIKTRDAAFIERFCQQGTFMAEDSHITPYVCRPVDANELMTFLHSFDEELLAILKEHGTTD